MLSLDSSILRMCRTHYKMDGVYGWNTKKWIINSGAGKGKHFCLKSEPFIHFFISEMVELLFKAALAASELKFSEGISGYPVIPWLE